MGWNSWDSYGYTVRETEVKANADFMAAHMAGFGWQYVVVDIEWYTPKVKTHGYIPDPSNVTLDAYGRFIPAPIRFPSANNGRGFKPLADYVHSKGLRFGIHIMRGIPRKAVEENLPISGSHFRAGEIANKNNVCKWKGMADTYGVGMSKPGAQDYYDSIAALYASWGVDYVKADDMSQPYQAAEIHALSIALQKTGRSIVLSLSPGPSPLEKADDLRKYAQLWRISGDFWDEWKPLKHQFKLAESWARYSGGGSWPDADMLPLGRIGIRAESGDDRMTRFTQDEQYTLMTLWAIFRSPLMMGGDLPSSDAFTLALLTNREVLQVNQHSTDNHAVISDEEKAVWVAKSESDGTRYVAVFNLGDSTQTLEFQWHGLGLPEGSRMLRDLWLHKNLEKADSLRVTLPAHGAALYSLQ